VVLFSGFKVGERWNSVRQRTTYTLRMMAPRASSDARPTASLSAESLNTTRVRESKITRLIDESEAAIGPASRVGLVAGPCVSPSG
jgi:hypothetical protein